MAAENQRRYELLMLTIPEITQDEAEKLRGQVSKIIAQAEGNILSWDRWGKYLLAYPVHDYEYGVYFLMRFDLPPESPARVIQEIRHTFRVRFTNVVMRHMFQALDPDASLDYQRPESLEDKPHRDVTTFLKENKMSGVGSFSSPDAAQKASNGQQQQASQEQQQEEKAHEQTQTSEQQASDETQADQESGQESQEKSDQ